MKKIMCFNTLVILFFSALYIAGNTYINAATAEWVNSDGGWWYRYEDGSYAKSEYIDGYWIDAFGWYVSSYYGTWKSNSNDWWYEDAGWYPVNQWLKIDKKWYHFNSKGYMDSDKWVGKSYVDKDGVWIPDYTNPDGTVGSGDNGKVIVIDPGHSSVVASGSEPLGPGSSETFV